MNSFHKLAIRTALILAAGLGAISVHAQDARLHFERLSSLADKARDVVEVNIDGKLLNLAKRVTAKVDDPNAKQVAEAISGLKGIYVRVYNFEKENEYDVSDVDQIRAELNNPGWEKVANVRSKRNNQKVDVYTMFTGADMSGAAVVISDTKSVAVINVIGMVDIEALVQLSGKLDIPKFEIDRDTRPAPQKPGN
jgi:hypothetical protein